MARDGAVRAEELSCSWAAWPACNPHAPSVAVLGAVVSRPQGRELSCRQNVPHVAMTKLRR